MSITLIKVNNDFNILFSLKDDDVDPDYMLLKLYRRVLTYNIKEVKKIIRKSSEKLTYKTGQIVLFTIPLKNRLIIKATRLPCRILIIVKSAYTLLF